MNPNTGELMMLQHRDDIDLHSSIATGDVEWDDAGFEKPPPGFKRLPAGLQPAARRVLRGRKMTHVSLTSGGKLAKWAAAERSKQKRRKANKSAKASRKKNRK